MSSMSGSKRVIGLTGGIACGKSTVAEMFRDLGVVCIDADALAREVVAKGTPGLAAIVDAFGEEILHPDGTLHREALGERVFGDKAARKRLEAITHPAIGMLGAQRISEALAGETPYVLYEAAVLIESGAHRLYPELVVVRASPAVQRERLMARDARDAASADARIASQMPVEEKVKLATYVIDNDGSVEETRAQVESVHGRILGGNE